MTDQDPVVLRGQRLKELRVQFWEYMSLPLLKAFASIVACGDFGRVDGFTGQGVTADGNGYAFSWKKNGRLKVHPVGRATCCTQVTESACNTLHALPVKASPGAMTLTGLFDYEAVNRIRNFQMFHLRKGLYFLK